jgi:hypothetical protein
MSKLNEQLYSVPGIGIKKLRKKGVFIVHFFDSEKRLQVITGSLELFCYE